MSDKTLYTIIVHSENIAGLLNQVTAVFTRRQINIESLNVSASSIKGVHKYTITAWTDKDTMNNIPIISTNIANFLNINNPHSATYKIGRASCRERV